ncbi:MAG TPA: hypothetical protein PLV45_04685 [bacterium]|nr:hypothetical protein [bacterium]
MKRLRNERGSIALPLVLGAIIILMAYMTVLSQSHMRSSRVLPEMETTLEMQNMMQGFLTGIMQNGIPEPWDRMPQSELPAGYVPGYTVRITRVTPVSSSAWRLDIQVSCDDPRCPGDRASTWQVEITCVDRQCQVVSLCEQRSKESPGTGLGGAP